MTACNKEGWSAFEMSTRFLFFVGALCSAVAGIQAQPTAPNTTAIEHVNIVDVVAGAIRNDQTVLISNGRITMAGSAASVALPPDARIISAQGKYLLPGLWDMHVHLRSDSVNPGTRLAAENEAMLDLFLPNGVVGIAEMGGDLADHVIRWRDEIRAGKREGPRILTAGRKIDNDPPAWPGSIGVKTAEEARQAVDLNQSLGADFIKIYFHNTSSEVLRAVQVGSRSFKHWGDRGKCRVGCSLRVLTGSRTRQVDP